MFPFLRPIPSYEMDLFRSLINHHCNKLNIINYFVSIFFTTMQRLSSMFKQAYSAKDNIGEKVTKNLTPSA
jgi:hypothetical protein